MVSPTGDVDVSLSLRVDLHIDVQNGSLIGDCTAAPITLALRSTAPYDPATQRVTLADTNFTVPPVAITSGCSETIADGVNEALAGSGHSLRLTLQGPIELPPLPGDPSVTTLTASPAGGTRFGEDVTLTATVAPKNPPLPDAPTGSVEFLDGTTSLGIVDLTGDTAQLITDDIGLGSRTLTAKYRGDSNFEPSTSPGVPYTIRATPSVNVEVPNPLVIGADPVLFDLTIENPGAGETIQNARVDMSILNRLGVNNVTPDSFVLEVGDGEGNWSPVTFAPDDDPETALTPDSIVGSLGPLTGTELSPGETIVLPLRLSFPAEPNPARLARTDVRLDLQAVDPETGDVDDTIVSTLGSFNLVGAERVATTLAYGSSFNPPVSPPVVRQGNTVYITGINVTPTVGDQPTGSYSFEIDGQPVGATITFNNGLNLEPRSTIPILFSGGRVSGVTVRLPQWVGPGTHQFNVRYSGDHLYQPAFKTQDFQVLPAMGTLYDCSGTSLLQAYRLTMQVTAQADVPRAARAGSTVTLGRFDVALRADRGGETFNLFNQLMQGPTEVGGDRLKELEFGIGPDGTGTAEFAEFSGTRMRTPDTANPDILATFTGESGGLTIEGAPGDVVPVTLDSVRFQAETGTSTIDLECVPVGDPVKFGDVIVAGTSLEVNAPDPTRAGDLVGLTATVAPVDAVGVVEFVDNGDVIALANPAAGKAETIVQLDEGTHQLQARFRTGASAPSSSSAVVELEVLAALDCAPFAEAGNGAVVRLVYMELLGRCPDQAGFDYWVARLDSGTTPEVFARAISATPEAVGVVVDDAYQVMLGRKAEAAGKAFWVNRMRTGSGRYDQLLAELGASGEFWSQAGSSNGGFVTRVYEQLLNRTPEQAGQDYWVGRLQSGVSRRALIRTLANLDEPLGVLVSDAYDEILGRAPSGAESSDGVIYLRATGNRSGLYAQLIGRPEFSTRAQGFPNPED